MSEQEMIARALCDDPEARRIAGELEAPCFDDSRPDVQDYWRALAKVLTTLASRTPEGMVMVPREPTPEMVLSGMGAVSGYPRPDVMRAIYAAMLSASPTPSGAE